jgi:hypothetical protein
MWRVTFRGLVYHKVRYALTTIAVLLGVAFIAGTLVLTDTIGHTFDGLFADVTNTPQPSSARRLPSFQAGSGLVNGPRSTPGLQRRSARYPASPTSPWGSRDTRSW